MYVFSHLYLHFTLYPSIDIRDRKSWNIHLRVISNHESIVASMLGIIILSVIFSLYIRYFTIIAYCADIRVILNYAPTRIESSQKRHHKTKRHHSVKTERRHSVTFQSPFSRLNGRYISVTIQ